MATAAYQGTVDITFVPPPVVADDPASGAQQAATQAVVGLDAASTPSLPYQPIGGAVVAGAFVPWDGTMP